MKGTFSAIVFVSILLFFTFVIIGKYNTIETETINLIDDINNSIDCAVQGLPLEECGLKLEVGGTLGIPEIEFET